MSVVLGRARRLTAAIVLVVVAWAIVPASAFAQVGGTLPLLDDAGPGTVVSTVDEAVATTAEPLGATEPVETPASEQLVGSALTSAEPSLEAVVATVAPVVQAAQPALVPAEPFVASREPLVTAAAPVLATTETALDAVGLALAPAEPVLATVERALAPVEPVLAATEPILAASDTPAGAVGAIPSPLSTTAPATLAVDRATTDLPISAAPMEVHGPAPETPAADADATPGFAVVRPAMLAQSVVEDILRSPKLDFVSLEASGVLVSPEALLVSAGTLTRRSTSARPSAPARPSMPAGVTGAAATPSAAGSGLFFAALAAAVALAAPHLGRRLRPGAARWPLPILQLSLERPG